MYSHTPHITQTLGTHLNGMSVLEEGRGELAAGGSATADTNSTGSISN